MTITPFLLFFYFTRNPSSFSPYVLLGFRYFGLTADVMKSAVSPDVVLFCYPKRENSDNVINLNSRRIEYLRARLGCGAFMKKVFSAFLP